MKDMGGQVQSSVEQEAWSSCVDPRRGVVYVLLGWDDDISHVSDHIDFALGDYDQ